MPGYSVLLFRIALVLSLIAFGLPARVLAAGSPASAGVSPTGGPSLLAFHWVGYSVLFLFVLAYWMVIMEEQLQVRKSIPVMLAAGIIWSLVALGLVQQGQPDQVSIALRHYVLEYGELFLFILTAVTYVNAMEERGIFDSLRGWLLSRRFSLRQLFWITGGLAFCISPVADNLTTALVLGSVVLAVTRQAHFISLSCVNVVVAANAGGAFSPFGDITTLMVWQKGMVSFSEFFALFLPSLVNWLVPASLMSLTIARVPPEDSGEAPPSVRPGGFVVASLFFGTIATTVVLHSVLHIPPAVGMMAGLSFLKLYGHFLHRYEIKAARRCEDLDDSCDSPQIFDVFSQYKRLEWDTMMFFYGIILCVGALNTLGYLTMGSEHLYGGLGPTLANVVVGLGSAVLDNIPLMYAVLSVQPDMSHAQWLLVTLTTGVGGSLLSIGSAAGVALMGLAPGTYTFKSHLRWSWAIALGYAASIAAHLVLNGR